MTISLLRTLLLYIVIIIAVRLMGKRQISELQTSELVVTLLISDIAAIPMQDTGQPLVDVYKRQVPHLHSHVVQGFHHGLAL